MTDSRPDSAAHDFDDPDLPGDANPSPLRRLILAQHDAPGGAAVALFTSATLRAGTGDAGPGEPQESDSGLGERRVAEVRDRAGLLGVDLPGLSLFSVDAYVLQSALGEQLLGDAP